MAPAGRLLTSAAVALGLLVAGCSGDDAPSCAVTEPVAAADLPEVLRGSGEAWTGRDGLWTTVPGAEQFITDDGPPRLKHAWVTLDEDGQPTQERGDPGVGAEGLDGQGAAAASHGGYAHTDELSWWPTVVEFPASGCWSETGVVDGVEVRVVYRVP
ncbi:hypothetical protein [Ornithinicoccus hortensis]|uniref:hypothetical protein n=1 Tax=Ornithinicoccus hortensis TaxID=82346 RepID=UPI00114FCD24|nr:hypothetical protein [Ornithinicoccus hortensis]